MEFGMRILIDRPERLRGLRVFVSYNVNNLVMMVLYGEMLGREGIEKVISQYQT